MRMPAAARFCAILIFSYAPKKRWPLSVLLAQQKHLATIPILAGLDTPSGGAVLLESRYFCPEQDARAALRAQRWALSFRAFAHGQPDGARKRLMLPLELAGQRDARQRATQMLHHVGLGQRLQHYPKVLSGGEQQRVALANAVGAAATYCWPTSPLAA